jgi:hypothetical protein
MEWCGTRVALIAAAIGAVRLTSESERLSV